MPAKNAQVLNLTKEQSQFMDDVLTLCSEPGRGLPELIYAFLSVKIFAVEGDPSHTMSCDSKWNVYINFDRFMNKPESYLTTVSALAHEVLHLLMNHWGRDTVIIDDEVVPRDTIVIAEELEINSSLFNNKHVYGKPNSQGIAPSFDLVPPMEGRILCPGRGFAKDFPHNLSMEQYVHYMYDNRKTPEDESQGGSGGNGEPGSEENGDGNSSNNSQGSPSNSNDESNEVGNISIGGSMSCSGATDEDQDDGIKGTGAAEGSGLSDIQIDSVKMRTAQEIEDRKEQGIGSGISPHLIRWADGVINGVKLPVGRVIKDFGTSIERTKAMTSRKTYARPNRRPGLDRRMIRPTRNDNKINVAFIGDTSMSMGEKEGAIVKGAVADLLRRPDVTVTAYTFDTSVHVQDRIRRVEDIQWIGGGGTDIRVPLNYIRENHHKNSTDYAIVLTDCGTPWPDKTESFPFPVLIIGTDTGDYWFRPPEESELPDGFKVEVIEAS